MEAEPELLCLISVALLPSGRLQRRSWPLFLAGAYLGLLWVLGGLKAENALVASLVLLDSYNELTRRFLGYFYPLVLTGVFYDSMRFFYWQGIQGHVHVAEPYYRDLAWFGIAAASGRR